MKKVFVILLALVLLLGTATPAFAAEDVTEPATEITEEEPTTTEPVTEPDETDPPEQPAAPLTYIEALRLRYKEAFENIRAHGSFMVFSPVVVPMVGYVPLFGAFVFLYALASPFLFLGSLGELIFCPVIALFDVISQA